MEVILLEDVKSLGKKGEKHKVSDGYGRNLISKKLCLEATAKNLNDLKLQKKLLRNVPHTVYHYTDCNALLSIIDNNELWATHINFLNDNQEFKCAYDEVIKNIKDSKKQERFAAKIEELTEKIGIYVLSFTLKEDDLDQWRGYRGSSQSICIGFDVTKIKGVFFKEKAIEVINKFIEKGYFSNEKKVSLFFGIFEANSPLDIRRTGYRASEKFLKVFSENLKPNLL